MAAVWPEQRQFWRQLGGSSPTDRVLC